ncbi:MAG: GPP34 family phosphoprotein [Henriciella sp.]
MELSLPQAMLLLSLNDKTGKTEDGYYQPAFGGAALADLLLHGTIELEADSSAVVPLRHTGSLGAFLDMCDKELGTAPGPKEISYWISSLGNQKDLIATIADELCHLGALTREKTSVFGLFTRTVWPEASPALEAGLKAEMANAMFQEIGAVEERLCLTIALANAVDLLQYNFDPDLLTTHADRIAAISKGECVEAKPSEAVLKAVKDAIRAANAISDVPIATIIS